MPIKNYPTKVPAHRSIAAIQDALVKHGVQPACSTQSSPIERKMDEEEYAYRRRRSAQEQAQEQRYQQWQQERERERDPRYDWMR